MSLVAIGLVVLALVAVGYAFLEWLTKPGRWGW